jgi:hypothetical protein
MEHVSGQSNRGQSGTDCAIWQQRFNVLFDWLYGLIALPMASWACTCSVTAPPCRSTMSRCSMMGGPAVGHGLPLPRMLIYLKYTLFTLSNWLPFRIWPCPSPSPPSTRDWSWRSCQIIVCLCMRAFGGQSWQSWQRQVETKRDNKQDVFTLNMFMFMFILNMLTTFQVLSCCAPWTRIHISSITE